MLRSPPQQYLLSLLQKTLDADFAKPGVDRSNTYMLDEPRYEKMAFAAALGSIDSDMSDLSSLKMLLTDRRNLPSSLKSSIQHDCEVCHFIHCEKKLLLDVCKLPRENF